MLRKGILNERDNPMSSKRKTIFNLVFLVVVFVLTIHFVFRLDDIVDILHSLIDADCR